MAHWAEIDENGTVIRVLVGDNNDPAGDEGHQWLLDNLGGTWVKTSYNTRGGVNVRDGGEPLHKNFAGRGYSFDGVGFSPPQPFPSWTKNKDTYLWEPPMPMPESGSWFWDEDALSWVALPE